MQTVYWLILFVILLVIEIFTMGLTTIWFAGGALVAFVTGILGVWHGGTGDCLYCSVTGAADCHEADRGEDFLTRRGRRRMRKA